MSKKQLTVPKYLPHQNKDVPITKGNVTKYEFQIPVYKMLEITSLGLHFIPGDNKSCIVSHQHTEDSERYFKLVIHKDIYGNIIQKMKWLPLTPVSASTPDCSTHSIEPSDEIQIIYGIKRLANFNKTNWPKDELPKVSYNSEFDLFRFKLGDEAIYTHSDFKDILLSNGEIYHAPNRDGQDYAPTNQINPTNNVVTIDELCQ